VLRGANLQGADLSTAQLYGPELRGAILHRDQLWSAGEKQTGRNKTPGQRPAQAPLTPIQVQPSSSSQPEQKRLSDREAFLIGERGWLPDADQVKIRQFFPQGFTFARARSLFDTWLAQTGTRRTDHEIQAIWIGFASRLCRLYHEESPES
jgi:Pentapeptide repeats (8 copies)